MTIYALGDRRPVLPTLGRYWIAPDANVIGDVTLGVDVGIWFCATLRGDTEPIRVGRGTNIQENTVVHTDAGYPVSIGEDCTIGHKAMIHGCTIGNATLIGMGATILNGARIGSGCLIGAGALVTEGKVIPDGSLVMGMPGKVVRQLDEPELQGIHRSAETYRERLNRYLAELHDITGDHT